MMYIQHVFFGLILAYASMIPPGMLNMTALKLRLKNGRKESLLFSIGASVIVFFQAGIALYFADYLIDNKSIVEFLESAAIVVFFLLSIIFYILASRKVDTGKSSVSTNNFLKGIGLSVINLLAVPFYLAMSIYLVSKEIIMIEHPYLLFFVIGAGLGSLLLLLTYMTFAKMFEKRISFIAKNINYILSVLFLIVGILTFYKISQPN